MAAAKNDAAVMACLGEASKSAKSAEAELDLNLIGKLIETAYVVDGTTPVGKTATATAVGDLDCDGTTITYTLRATTDSGSPVIVITPPTNAD